MGTLEPIANEDERDTRLEGSGAFIMPQSTASAFSGRVYVR